MFSMAKSHPIEVSRVIVLHSLKRILWRGRFIGGCCLRGWVRLASICNRVRGVWAGSGFRVAELGSREFGVCGGKGGQGGRF